MKMAIIFLWSIVFSSLIISSNTWADDVKLYGPGEVPSVKDITNILSEAGSSNMSSARTRSLKTRAYSVDGDPRSGKTTLITQVPEVISSGNVDKVATEPSVSSGTGDPAKSVSKLAMQIMFALNSYLIDPSSYAGLDNVAKGIAPYQTTIMIEGHTDASGSPEYNLRLSQKRAEAVRDYLIKKGITADRLIPIGLASTRLFNKNDPYAASNRRVQFSLY